MLPKEFYEISPRHFSLMIKGNEAKKVESLKKTRLLMFTMVRLMGDSKTAPKTPEELWQLPGDEKQGIDEEEVREIFKRLGDGINNRRTSGL